MPDHMDHANYLYRNIVFGHFVQYRFTLGLIFIFHLLLFLLLRAVSRTRFDEVTEHFCKETRKFRRSYFLAVWLTLVAYLSWAWLLSIYKDPPSNAYRVGYYVIAAAVILFLTFSLEGLEIAFTDLRDKDPHQISVKTFDDASRMRDSFYEAREWAVVLLLVIATLMIESGFYELPYLGRAGDVQEGWGKFVRILISIVLTTFPFVWFAQSPGKAVARNNSLGFLSYKVNQLVASALQIIRRALGFIGLQFPSEEAEDLAFKILRYCRIKRNLPPSEFSFFANALKKYGCGFLVQNDNLTIHVDGSCEFISSAVIYVSIPRRSVKRHCEFESPFLDGTIADLQNPEGSDSVYWAFRAPLIGERITDDDLSVWNSLLFSENPEKWSNAGYTSAHKGDFQTNAEIEKPTDCSKNDGRPTHRLVMELDFTKEQPALSANKGGTEALLILWRIRAVTKKDTVIFPTERNVPIPYPFTKKYALPSLRSTLKATLDDKVTSCRFDYPAGYMVTYEGVVHDEERERFQTQLRSEEPNIAPVKANEKKSLVFYVDSPLPSGDYKYTMRIATTTSKGSIHKAPAAEEINTSADAVEDVSLIAAAEDEVKIAASADEVDIALSSEGVNIASVIEKEADIAATEI